MFLKRSLQHTAWRAGSLRARADQTVLISGTPRGGTTWLLETLERLPGTRRVWEPFLPPADQRPVPQASNFGLGLRPYLHPHTPHPDLEGWLTRLLAGRLPARVGQHRGAELAMLIRLACARTTLAKFVRIQRLLPWFVQRFPNRVVMLRRDPYAVVASQLNHAGFNNAATARLHPVVTHEVDADFPAYAAYCRSLNTPEQRLAATWCLDWAIPRAYGLPSERVLELSYEDLMQRPGPAIARLERFLGKAFPTDMQTELTRPSATALTAPATDKWRRDLTSAQIRQIAEVLQAFGFDPAPGAGAINTITPSAPR